jgi:SAM-dependent methyltransferase
MTKILMESFTTAKTSVLRTAWRWWNDAAARVGSVAASRMIVWAMWEFLRDSMPARERQRYGDVDFDWEHRVNTTSAGVGWRERLVGVFHSAYQPTEPALFREMMDTLQHLRSEQTTTEQRDYTLAECPLVDRVFGDFTFIDLGSGKGRVLLMASDYPFRRIIGGELLPALHQIAQENLTKYRSELQRCFALESICGDAAEFQFPEEPIVLYLFNPFPESGLRRVLANLEQSLREHPRAVYVLYLNPLLEHVVRDCAVLRKIGGTDQYSVYEGCGILRSEGQNKFG